MYVDRAFGRANVQQVYKSQRRSRSPPTDPKTIPTTVPGEGELFCCPYVVGIMAGSLLIVCRDIRGSKSSADLKGEDSCAFPRRINEEIGCKRDDVLKVDRAECKTSLGIIEPTAGRESGTGAILGGGVNLRAISRSRRPRNGIYLTL